MSDIQELMATDPLKQSDQDIDAIIEVFRKARHQFNAGNMQAGSTKMTAKQKEALSLADKLDLEI